MSEDYYQDKDFVSGYIKQAAEVSGQQLIEILREFLSAGASVLELGSGPGTDWEILSATYEVTGSDLSTAFLDHLATQYPKAQFLQLDACTLKTEERFDGLYSNKVLHHLTKAELEASIKRQHDVVKPEGIICHSFWRGEGSEYFKDMLVTYHNAESLQALFGPYFEPLLIKTYQEFDPEDSLLLIARRRSLEA